MSCFKEFETNLEYHFSTILDYPLAKPYWVFISLSHQCTYSCQMCGVVKILKGHELLEGAVKETLDAIASWRRNCTVLFTGGEVFLRKDILELIRYSAAKAIKVETVSNGSLINEELALKIVASGLQNIAISLDGAIKDTHDRIREPGAFKKAINAITYLVRAKKTIGKGPQISVWTTIMKENVNELFDIVALVKDLGVECLVYHPVIVAQDDMQNTALNAPFWIKGADLEILKRQIDSLVDYQSKHGFVAFLHDPYLWLKYFEGKLSNKDWKCNPFVFMNLGPDGEVRSCGSAFGNIKDLGLNECLISTEAVRARKIMEACQKPCLQTCWAHPESDSLLKIIEKFIVGVKSYKDRLKLIKAAMNILDSYEHKLIEHV